ncbi:hypothetical protein [Candidatus Nitrosocosmicus sp. T]
MPTDKTSFSETGVKRKISIMGITLIKMKIILQFKVYQLVQKKEYNNHTNITIKLE